MNKILRPKSERAQYSRNTEKNSCVSIDVGIKEREESSVAPNFLLSSIKL